MCERFGFGIVEGYSDVCPAHIQSGAGSPQSKFATGGLGFSVAFNQGRITDFQQLTNEAREQIRLTEEGDSDRFFT